MFCRGILLLGEVFPKQRNVLYIEHRKTCLTDTANAKASYFQYAVVEFVRAPFPGDTVLNIPRLLAGRQGRR